MDEFEIECLFDEYQQEQEDYFTMMAEFNEEMLWGY